MKISFNIIYLRHPSPQRFMDSTTSHHLSQSLTLRVQYYLVLFIPHLHIQQHPHQKFPQVSFCLPAYFAHSVSLKFPLVPTTPGRVYITGVRITTYSVTTLDCAMTQQRVLNSHLSAPLCGVETAVYACVKQEAFLPPNTRLGVWATASILPSTHFMHPLWSSLFQKIPLGDGAQPGICEDQRKVQRWNLPTALFLFKGPVSHRLHSLHISLSLSFPTYWICSCIARNKCINPENEKKRNI